MEDKVTRLLLLADRVLLHLEHQIPPEEVATQELRQLINELKAERQLKDYPELPR